MILPYTALPYFNIESVNSDYKVEVISSTPHNLHYYLHIHKLNMREATLLRRLNIYTNYREYTIFARLSSPGCKFQQLHNQMLRLGFGLGLAFLRVSIRFSVFWGYRLLPLRVSLGQLGIWLGVFFHFVYIMTRLRLDRQDV